MTSKQFVKIGVVGCGAIGSRIAKAIQEEFKDKAKLSALYDIDIERAYKLSSELKLKSIAAVSLEELIQKSRLVVEAASAKVSKEIASQAIQARRDVLVMSVGGLLNAEDVFTKAQENNCHIHIPSGAICGIDGIKAAAGVRIDKLILTTRKPPRAFIGVQYLLKRNINLDRIKEETVLFEGDAQTAVKLFPQNINVASTLALASGLKDKMQVCIITSPEYKGNRHEILLKGEFGSLNIACDNVPCPDNFKTSYLAVLSAIATLRQILNPVRIGT